MVLVIVNYDSFTYNLVQYLGEMQVDLHVHRNDQISMDTIRGLKPERILSPDSFVEHGPGEIRIRSGFRQRIVSIEIWSFRCTCKSTCISPRYCTRLYVNES